MTATDTGADDPVPSEPGAAAPDTADPDAPAPDAPAPDAPASDAPAPDAPASDAPAPGAPAVGVAPGDLTTSDVAGLPSVAASEPVVRRRRVKARQRRLTEWQAVTSVVFIALLAGLAFVGYKASLRVGGGSAERVTDPKAPGYTAAPVPTTVDLYGVTDNAGALASVLMVVPDPSGKGGTAVPIPPSFVVPEYQGAPPKFLSDVFAEGGIDGLRNRLGLALNVKIGSAEVVPVAAVTALAGPTPVVIDNVDNLATRAPDGTHTVKYPAGTLSIEPDKVTDFLGFQGADDPAPNQALRAQAVWKQLLDRGAKANLAGLPSGQKSENSDSPGFGPAMSSLVAGEHSFDLVPMVKVPVPNSYFVAWMPDPKGLNGFVARVVPVPQSPVAGSRVPVRILNGTSSPTAYSSVVPVVVGAGAEVVLIGNAESFDVATTRVEYGSDDAKVVADTIAGELGVTATKTNAKLDNAAINVVIGSDNAK